ncbi:BglG family transcription antiterminator LicT [Allobaculum sp. JKK-2023]|uniref:BglG family transcription antiterminator LicT n=1 Tax=Allobaculum sp. JKK-2023 TaxID=3108943 RepID=UPI002B05A055|nr:PRD domain-containing protein [Allobaculum sp. JKK-2023]
MNVEKVINNNLVRSRNLKGHEILVMGSGLGFKKKPGDEIDCLKVEKIYRLDTPKEQQDLELILARAPLEVLQAVNEIVAYGKNSLHTELSDGLTISLADHISFAVKRHREGLDLRNALLSELRSFYPHEYEIGKVSLQIIQKYTGELLPEDEAGFIALHFINVTSQMNSMSETNEMMQLIRKILSLVEYDCQIELNRKSIQYERFVTHLKYFSRRLFAEKQGEETKTDPGLYQMIKSSYKKAYLCALKVANLTMTEYGKKLSDEELIYLSIHINRLIDLFNQNNRNDL